MRLPWSVAATRLSGNDISSLAQIFATSLQFYREHNSPLEKDYIEKLTTLVGLSFTATMVDANLLSIYHSYLSIFLSNIHFRKKTSDIRSLSLAVAGMVEGAAGLFRLLRYPDYHKPFIKALKETVMHIVVRESDKSEEAKRLLQILCSK